MADSRFDNVNYVCWLKVCMALIFAKEGLEKLTDKLAKIFHDDIKNRLGSSECSSCSKNDLKKQWQNGRWRCRANVCNRWLDEIRRNLQHPKETIEWDNSDISCLPFKPWECIKLFMPYGCESVTEAGKADIAAILTLFINNGYFLNLIGGQATTHSLVKVKEIRNTIMHSCNLELEETKMEEYMDTITKMLKCHPTLNSDQSCKEAISKIHKLKSDIVEVSLQKEYELRSLNARVRTMESKLNQSLNRFNTQKNEIEELRTNDMGFQSHVEIINTKYRELHRGSQELKAEVENMNGFLSNFLRANGIENIDIGIINEKITSLNTLVNDVDEMKYDIGEIKQKIARMESEKSNWTSYEKRTNDLQRSLIELYKDCCSVSVCSLRPNLTRKLSVLYVKQSMIEKNPRGSSKPQAYITPSSDSEHENKKIETLNDVFFKNSTLCKNIYMTGEAGVGKSTFCVHLLDLWLKAHSNTDVLHLNTEDLQTMKQFSLLFYIRLRGVKLDFDSDAFINIISEQLGLDMDIKEFLKRETCLILADALDESVDGKPVRALWNKSTILITSRPWKIEALRDFIEGNAIDREIEIISLDERSAKKLVENVLPILAKESESSVKSSSDFLAAIKENDLGELFKVPILLIHMLCLWHDNSSVGDSYYSIYKNIFHNQIMVYIKSKHKEMSLTSKDKINPLRCKSYCPCIDFGELLVQVGKLAFKSLVSENRANELVFDHNITQIYGMSEKCTEICLRIGILSQCKLIGKILEHKKYMSFVHKTNQEFHAAIYLAHAVQVSELKSVLKIDDFKLDGILKLEKVIMFVSALNSKMGREITRLLLEAAEQDVRIQNYRSTVASWSLHFELVFNVQKVILNAMKESKINQHQQQFNLDDIVVYHENMSCVLSCLSETSQVTSIHIRGESDKYILDYNIMMHIKDTSRLQRIELYWCTVSRLSILQNLFSNVIALCLGWVQISHSDLSSVCSRLATAEKLRQLMLDGIECEIHGELEEGICRALRLNLSRLDKLEKLYIGPCEMPAFVISPVLINVKQIILGKVTTTATILEELVNNLPNNNVRVKLWRSKIRHEEGASSPNTVIDFIRHSCGIKYDRVEMRDNGDMFVDKLEFHKSEIEVLYVRIPYN